MILLSETDLYGGAVVAEKIRARIEEHEFELRARGFPVTITFGVCAWNPSMSVDECIRLADEALYAGKKGGKNRVMEAISPSTPPRLSQRPSRRPHTGTDTQDSGAK